ncbi:sensor histidine kinase [Aquimarina agarilytica]|uniref:sensor histidine kinase n=1 Tax=Aquimarina agarilytica TaxID=1087449 RepID=UPI000288DF27|nr:ATP-binding protein [Aquimarina agarilytica]
MDEKQITELFLMLSIVAIIIAIVLVTLFIIFQQRKNKLLLKQKETEKHFEKEITSSKIEIREEAFRNISWELHDNIGQLITLAKLQIQNNDTKDSIDQTLTKALTELRILSKLANPEALKAISFTDALQQEIDRFNRLNYLKSSLKIAGKVIVLDPKVETVLFRILQEFLSNTIKHAKATELCLNLNYTQEQLQICVCDNGIGFNSNQTGQLGIGLTNIAKRAQLIGAIAEITSSINEGTKLTITYIIPHGNF